MLASCKATLSILQGGLDCIANTRKTCVTREGLEKANEGGRRHERCLWEGINFTRLDMIADPDVPFQSSCDIYGDGSLVVCPVPRVAPDPSSLWRAMTLMLLSRSWPEIRDMMSSRGRI